MPEFIGKLTGNIIGVSLLVFVGSIIGTLAGVVSGWAIGLLFEDTILGILATLGITGFKMWQVGCFLGFIGGFFKSSMDLTKKSE